MRVIVVDDSVLLREGIVRLLDEAGHEVVAQHRDATTLIESVTNTHPDLVLLDIRMPPTHTTEGLDAAAELRRTFPGLGVVVLSQYTETRSAVELLADDRGGLGYLLKDRIAEVGEFLDALVRVAAGGSVIDPSVVARLVSRERRNNPIDALTERERDVLGLMAEGRSNAAIAERLGVQVRTVESHVSAILTKLGVHDEPDDHRRVRAVVLYLSHVDGR